MAQEYGFEYELITYKWPTWLHKQKEKQRIIWAYKILFLDVIFPLSLRKVVFSILWSTCNPASWSSIVEAILVSLSSNDVVSLILSNRLFLSMLIKLWEQTWESCMTWIWRAVPLHILHSVITTRRWMATDSGNKLVTNLAQTILLLQITLYMSTLKRIWFSLLSADLFW
jgi:hypothetical protein